MSVEERGRCITTRMVQAGRVGLPNQNPRSTAESAVGLLAIAWNSKARFFSDFDFSDGILADHSPPAFPILCVEGFHSGRGPRPKPPPDLSEEILRRHPLPRRNRSSSWYRRPPTLTTRSH